jgi:hypothetical protein
MCSWAAATGAIVGTRLLDAFVDPSDASHIFALANAQSASSLYESHDGGQTFGAPLYVAPAGALLTGVEVAKSAPSSIYLTGFAGSDPQSTRAFLVRKTTSFELLDQSAVTGNGILRIAAVDPSDDKTLYLRVLGQGTDPDRLAISRDAGTTLHIVLDLGLGLGARMSSFLRRADGALLVGTADGDLFTSTDGGDRFSHTTLTIHLGALSERDGTLYAAVDNLLDHFALASSLDGGQSWTPVMAFAQISGPRACGDIPAMCDGPWDALSAVLHPDALANPSSQPPMMSGCRVAAGDGWAGLALVLVLIWWRQRFGPTGHSLSHPVYVNSIS